jgi:hypothetical protein
MAFIVNSLNLLTMFAIDFPEKNLVLRKPSEWDGDECYALDVYHGPVFLPGNRSVEGFISCWQMTDEDINELIKNKGKVYLQILYPAHPPVSLYTANPFELAVTKKDDEPPPSLIIPG